MTDFVYITSVSYSGSTLMTFLLNAHPSIATIGEMKGGAKDPEQFMCSCGQPIGQCAFWCELVERLNARGIPFDHRDVWSQCGFRIAEAPFADRVVRHRYRGGAFELARNALLALTPAARRNLPRIRTRNEAFVEAALDIRNRPVFLDSSKDPIRLRFLRDIESFRIRVIHMVRDGRGVMNSFMKRQGLSPELAALQWVRRENEIRSLEKTFEPSRWMLLRYEDLCTDPDATLAKTFEFLDLPAQDVSDGFRNAEHHILGNAMRFGSTSEIKLDTKWQRDLTPEQIETFEQFGGALNRDYGYEPV